MNRSGVWVGSALAVIAVVALLVLSSQQPDGVPFDAGSTAPDGYAALAILLRDRGDEVRSATAAEVAERTGWSLQDVLVVPVPAYATSAERESFTDAARAGATVVYGEPVQDGAGTQGEAVDVPFDSYWIDARTLADTPADPVGSEVCDMAELAGLGPVDAAFARVVTVGPDDTSCYGRSGAAALFQRRVIGAGSLVTLGSPYLWANARLQPAKEIGGRPRDNAATALRVLASGDSGELGTSDRSTRITVVVARPSPGAAINGSRDPLELLPVPVKLALVQLVAAFGIFVWWRSRRLGRPISERMPVEIAGSELVVAVGDLLRRKGNPTRAAGVLRAEIRSTLGSRLGVPPSASVDVLSFLVAQRTGRDPAQVHAALADGQIADSEGLVRLARTLDSIRQEVLDVPVLR